ncbi:MAG TPA: cytochrome c3 family protein, partial [Isosphaeraceae bacterium]
QAEQSLYEGNQTCTECHLYDQPPDRVRLRKGQAPEFKVLGPGVPSVWFPHAAFDHSAHRAVTCQQCHPQAYETDAKKSKSDDVMLPSIDTCRQCHAPAQRVAGTPRGGARFDCVECHRYHHGDRPEQGVGALAQGALQRVGLENFLQPTGHRSRSPTGAIPARTSKAPPGSP